MLLELLEGKVRTILDAITNCDDTIVIDRLGGDEVEAGCRYPQKFHPDWEALMVGGPEAHGVPLGISVAVRDITSGKSREQAETPLQRFLTLCAEKLPAYTVRVYLLDSLLWLLFPRRRVYVMLTHARVGGPASADRQANMMQAVVAARLSQPAATTADIMLPENDEQLYT